MNTSNVYIEINTTIIYTFQHYNKRHIHNIKLNKLSLDKIISLDNIFTFMILLSDYLTQIRFNLKYLFSLDKNVHAILFYLYVYQCI